MPDKKKNLYLFEAIELRNEYDRHIKLLQELLDEPQGRRERFLSGGDDDENREPAAGFDRKRLQEKLKKLQTKRVKLNQEIQVTNFNARIDHSGEKISIAEALEVRKNLLADKAAMSLRVVNSAYKRVVHKEERDIVHEPQHSFKESYGEFQDNLKKLRQVVDQIHVVNHTAVVKFKDE